MSDSFGAKLWAKTETATTYTEVAAVIEGDAAKLKKMVQERKHLGQADRYVKKRGTFTDGGSLAMKIEFEKVMTTFLKTWFDEPGVYDVRIEFPDLSATDGKVHRFGSKGVLEELGVPLPAEGGRVETDIAIAVSGAVTFSESVTPTAGA